MIFLCMLVVVIIIVISVWIAIKRLKPSFDAIDVHPECMMCNEESCVGCPLIEAKEKNLK